MVHCSNRHALHYGAQLPVGCERHAMRYTVFLKMPTHALHMQAVLVLLPSQT
jgi:hypothetical protein